MKPTHLVLLLLGGAAAVALLLRDVAPPPPADAPITNARRFRLALTVQDQTRLPVANAAAIPIDAQVKLQSDLIVSEPTSDTRRLRFERVDEATLSIGNGERKSASAAEQLEGLDVLVVLKDGVVTGVRLPASTGVVAERFAKLVASELVWTAPKKERHVVHRRTRLGEVQSLWAWSDAETLQRRHQDVRAWAALDGLGSQNITAEFKGGARATVDGDKISALRVDEQVLAYDADRSMLLDASTRLDLDLLERIASPPKSAPPFGPMRSLKAHRSSAEANAQHNKQRIAGLTQETLLTALDRTGASGEFADHAQTLARATALMRAEAQVVAALGARFRQETTRDAERTLLLDLMVGAGTPRAQEELVGLLNEPVVRTHPERHLWDQRLSLVSAPTPATVDYAKRAFAERTGTDQTAAAYALGGISSHLRGAEAAEAAAPIVQRLGSAETAPERAHLISALGNAGQTALVHRIASFASAAEPEVRLAAAKALRKTDVADARTALLRLSADTSAVVQRRALLSLARLSVLRGDELATLSTAVRGGSVAETSFGAVVNLMAAQPCSARRNDVLSAVRARPKETGVALDARTRTLEARCDAAGLER